MHWVLANADARDGDPTIFTAPTHLLGQMGSGPVVDGHRSWHLAKLQQIQR